MRVRLMRSIVFLLSVTAANAQAPPAEKLGRAAALHEGCVTATTYVPKTLVLAEADSCSVLTGKLAADQLKGRLVVLTGSMTEATSINPQTITIDKIHTVGAACHRTCELEPPGSRGLKKRERPGNKGGTPGE